MISPTKKSNDNVSSRVNTLVIGIKTLPFLKKILKIMIRNLTFELVLLNKNNNFYTRNSSLKRPEIKKNKESPKKQTEQPSCSSHLNKGTEEVMEKYKSTRKSKIYKMIPAPCPSTCTLIKKITHTSPILPPFVISVQLT